MSQPERPTPATDPADDLFVTGKQIVRYDGRVCHLACRRYYFKFRVLEGDAWKVVYRGRGDRAEYAALKGRFELLEPAPEVPLADLAFWRGFFAERAPGGA